MTTKRKTSVVVVLLSGGQDSTTCLYWTKREWPGAEVHALTLLYGQRHHAETGAAVWIGRMAGVATHKVATVPILSDNGSALTDERLDLRAEGGIPDAEMPQGLPTSFVPGRNLVFLALGAAFAAGRGADVLVTGVCQTDYSGYPDCRRGFVDALEDAARLSMPSGHPTADLWITTPLMHMTKADTVRLARELPGCWAALGQTVTCYHGRRPGCGECPACRLRARGFAEAGEIDPATEVP